MGQKTAEKSVQWFYMMDPLAEMAHSWTPYRYAFNNPLSYIDPDGLWEFKYTYGDDGSTTGVTLNAQEGDNWKSFRKQTGLSNKEMRSMFGDDYKNILNDKGEKLSTFTMSEIGGKIGGMLQEIENSILNLNSGDLTGNNCWRAAIQLTSDGRINPNGWLSNFDELLKNVYTEVPNPHIGDIIRYGDDSPVGGIIPTHGSVFLLRNKNGTQVYTKNGYSSISTYEIMSEDRMLNENPYGVRRGIDRSNTSISPEGITHQSTTKGSAIFRRRR